MVKINITNKNLKITSSNQSNSFLPQEKKKMIGFKKDFSNDIYGLIQTLNFDLTLMDQFLLQRQKH